jgi:hypothetical protein
MITILLIALVLGIVGLGVGLLRRYKRLITFMSLHG